MNRSILLESPGSWRLVTTDAPEPGPGEALVKVSAAGVCGSDRELHAGTRPEGFAAYPVTPGHEWSGTVTAVGAGTDPSLVGSPVVGEGYRACLACDNCRRGDTNLCTGGYDETGFTRPGAFADHLLLPARLLHVLAPGTDLRAAALLEPAAVVASALRKAAPRPGDSVAVVGAGTLGFLSLQLLAASSPAELTVTDPRSERERPALEAGATGFHPPEAAERLTGRFDVVVETAGAPGTAHTAVALARRGGRVVLTGIPGDPADAIPTSLIVTRALTLSSVFGATSADWTYAVRAFNAGILAPEALITHDLPLEDYERALNLSGSPTAGKVLLHP
ncbi:zinc-dependent alcohol dehydrogenase [Actinomadura alba]|uniref:Alcohol dehydrogenase catalytic domain-containing protein n=1 Tax=Actinomadura alba TaxID=406431 RepID=A0ABR7LTE3_9ACTN|nr:alcohol dehydrogenase catalytic domain-containing protein [Actinomadura alba]MBC6468125.1 alcohol dehydrogenase catalytic domain-containing protein [Actinomadura alba]